MKKKELGKFMLWLDRIGTRRKSRWRMIIPVWDCRICGRILMFGPLTIPKKDVVRRIRMGHNHEFEWSIMLHGQDYPKWLK